MVFTSTTFLFAFLPLTLAIYFACPRIPQKNVALLLLSLVFYAWGEPWFVLVMLGLTILNYYAAIAIEKSNAASKTIIFCGAIASNLGVLAVFKYSAFATATLNALTGANVPIPVVELPLGISFFTFHCISYLIDTFRRRVAPNKRFTEMALYIALFPQLVAGPIVRYKSIARQLGDRRHTPGRASIGMRIFIIGLAQKILVADQVASIANFVFDGSGQVSFSDAWLGALSYTLQIYFDFCGYSNMAIGLGLIFGFTLPRNFDLPYTSRSITEFWRRWHISLSSWFRDYVYIPLGGNRLGPLKTYRNLFIVFLLCGLWHGASWTFVLWGCYHGLFLILERLGLRRGLAFLPPALSWAWTFLVIMVGWILFRAETLDNAARVLKGIVGMNGFAGLSLQIQETISPLQLVTLVVAIALAIVPSRRKRFHRRALGPPIRFSRSDSAIALAGATVLLLLSLISISGGTYTPFLYFRF